MKEEIKATQTDPQKIGIKVDLYEKSVASRNIRLYIYGQLVSFFGTFMQSAVTGLLIVSLVPSEAASYWVGLNSSLMMLPTMVFAPFAGVFLDIWDKKAVLIGTSLLGIVYSVLLAGLTQVHWISVYFVLGLTLFSGLVNSIDAPGRTAIIKDSTNDNMVKASNRQLMSMVSVGQTIGPALAGITVINYGYGTAYLLNSLSFVVLIGALWKMRLVSKAKHVHEKHLLHTVYKTIWITLKYMLSDKSLRLCTIVMSLTVGLGYSCGTILVVIARDVFGDDPKNPLIYSTLGMFSGAGSLLAGAAMNWLEKHFRISYIVIGGNFIIGVGLLLLGSVSSPSAGSVLMLVINFGLMASVMTLRSTLSHLAKKELAGTVSGISTACFYAGLVVGPYLAGEYAKELGCRPVIHTFGALVLLLSIIIPFLPDTKLLDGSASKKA